MKTEMVDHVKDDRRRAKRRVRFAKAHDAEITRVIDGLVGVPGYINFRMDYNTCLDLSYSGDLEVLKAAFHAFRTLGYEPGSRPDDPKATGFTCFFTNPAHPELKWWFSFASTTCKKVKVGTEMKQVDVYETQCVQDLTEVELIPGYDGEADVGVIEHEG